MSVEHSSVTFLNRFDIAQERLLNLIGTLILHKFDRIVKFFELRVENGIAWGFIILVRFSIC